MCTLNEQILQLCVSEKIALVQEAWDAIAHANDDHAPVPQAVQQEVLPRNQWSNEHLQAHSSLQEIFQRSAVFI